MEIGTQDAPFASTTPHDIPTRPPSIYFTTFLGLAAGFFVLLEPLGNMLNGALQWTGMSQYGCWSLINVVDQLLASVVIIGIVLSIERKPLSSIGLRKPTFTDLGLGLALFAAVVIAGEGFQLILRVLFPHSMSNVANCQLNSFMRVPAGLGVLVAASAGFSEEVAARGFAIDRLRIVTGRLAVAAALALAVDLGAHIPFWGWRYAIEIAPMQLLFVLMYLWRRDIMACMIGHFLTDALPPLTPIAMTGVFSLLGYGGVHQALAYRDFMRGDNTAAIVEYTRALQLQPNDPELLKDRASVEEWNRDYIAAIADFNKRIAQDPKHPDPDMLESRAMAYFYAENPDSALSDINQAIALSPKDAHLYSTRSHVDEQFRQYDKSVEDLNLAIKYSRHEDENLYNRRGYAYVIQGDYGKAIADYNEAARLEPSDERVYEGRARAFALQNRPDLALADYARASSEEDFRDRADLYENEGNHRLALDNINRALAFDSADWETDNAAAWFLSTCPDPKFRDGRRGLKLAEKACALTVWKDPYAIDTLAAALAETGDFAQAVTWQEHAITRMKSQTAPGETIKEASERLDLYRKGQPYREKPGQQ